MLLDVPSRTLIVIHQAKFDAAAERESKLPSFKQSGPDPRLLGQARLACVTRLAWHRWTICFLQVLDSASSAAKALRAIARPPASFDDVLGPFASDEGNRGGLARDRIRDVDGRTCVHVILLLPCCPQLHRDVKANNIVRHRHPNPSPCCPLVAAAYVGGACAQVISPDGHVSLIDYGLATPHSSVFPESLLAGNPNRPGTMLALLGEDIIMLGRLARARRDPLLYSRTDDPALAGRALKAVPASRC